MSVPQYRKVAALALVAGLGLSLTACSTKGDDSGQDASGKVTITVDCQPVGAQKELLDNWNADVAAYEKVHTHMLHLSDVLSDGLIKQFPRRFR